MTAKKTTNNIPSAKKITSNSIPDANVSIRVTVNIPENVRDNIRQQKINRIYDILSP